jgi:ribosomal protein S18 acetylase RimI-like enzyme
LTPQLAGQGRRFGADRRASGPDAFENLGVASIETDVSNDIALSLYRKLGFTEVWQGTDFSPSLGLDQAKVRLEKSLL